MWNTKIKCNKCNAVIKKYDNKNPHRQYLKKWNKCPICGGRVDHEDWSPNL